MRERGGDEEKRTFVILVDRELELKGGSAAARVRRDGGKVKRKDGSATTSSGRNFRGRGRGGRMGGREGGGGSEGGEVGLEAIVDAEAEQTGEIAGNATMMGTALLREVRGRRMKKRGREGRS